MRMNTCNRWLERARAPATASRTPACAPVVHAGTRLAIVRRNRGWRMRKLAAPRLALDVEAVDAQTCAVQVQLLRGVKDEGRTTRGAAASMAAWLADGPTTDLNESFRVAVANAGLEMSVQTGWWSTTLTLTGSEASLEQALWLAYQRLVPTARISANGAADLQQALWNYDEALLRVRSPAGTPDDALLAAMLGGVGGEHLSLDGVAHNRDPESFARLARLALDTAPQTHHRGTT